MLNPPIPPKLFSFNELEFIPPTPPVPPDILAIKFNSLNMLVVFLNWIPIQAPPAPPAPLLAT